MALGYRGLIEFNHFLVDVTSDICLSESMGAIDIFL